MAKGFRFVGGSQHGTLRALPNGNQYACFPQYRPAAFEERATHSPTYHEERYEKRPLSFDGHARVYVMALSGMGEAEFMRRVADIIEGV
jgi:hypothetical protein